MKIVCTSDLHGHLPEIAPCDLLLIAGDICPVWNHSLTFQRQWLLNTFVPWLTRTKATSILCWGNHDLLAEKSPHLVPPIPATILTDQLDDCCGLRIYGLPWQKRFFDWAFNLDTPDLNRKYELIPDCDIIISHGPPFGYGDYSNEHCGSIAFVEAIDRIQPKLVVFGHIHEGSGMWTHGQTTLINATHMNEHYQPVHKPWIIEL